LTDEEIDFVRDSLPGCEEAFCDYLRGLDCSDIEVYAISEGSVVFPKVPLLRIEGPVAVSSYYLSLTLIIGMISF
jgi:nicotinate phosphoribosyltransferase